MSSGGLRQRLFAILAADAVGYSRLMSVDERATLELLDAARAVFRSQVESHQGHVIDMAGDSILAVFESAAGAVLAALAAQEKVNVSADAASDDRKMRFRVGVHLGDVFEKPDGTVYGDGVNIAARLQGLAEPGGIIVSDAIHRAVRGKVPAMFDDQGEQTAKNIAEPVRVFRVRSERFDVVQTEAEMSAPKQEGGPPEQTSVGPSVEFARRSTTIVVVDLVESVRLIHASEEEAVQRWRAFVSYVRDALLPRYGGRLVKSLGDGLLLAFRDSPSAVRCAYGMNQSVSERNSGCKPEAWMLLRIAVHEAEVFADDLDIYGKGVNLAARLATLAGPGEVVASVEVHDRLIADVDAELTDLGECFLKHLPAPVRVYRVGPPGAPAPMPAPVGEEGLFKASLAVLRFTVNGRDHQTGALGELLADLLVSHLSTCPDLHVISRLSSMRFDSGSSLLAKAAHHLRARFLVSGSCYVTSDSLFAVAEVADSQTGTALWSGRLSARLSELLNEGPSAVSEMATEIVHAIVSSEIRQAETRSLPTLQASTLLFGSIALMHRQNQNDLRTARQMLEHLADLYPRHSVPRAWLAKSYAVSAAQVWPGKNSTESKLARDAADRAVSNEPGNSLAWTIRGLVQGYFDKDFAAAEACYEAALSRNPSEALAWLYLAALRGWQGHGKEADEFAERALRLSPVDPMKYYFESLASAAMLGAENYPRAIELGERSLQHNRAHLSTFRVLAMAQELSGNHMSATQTVASLLVRDPSFTVTRFVETSPWMRSPNALLFKRALLAAGVPA